MKTLVRWCKYYLYPALIIALVRCFWGRSSTAYRPQPGARVTILRPDGIGDFMMFTSFLRELRRHWPDVTINLLVSPVAHSLAVACPYVDHVLCLPPEYYRTNKNNLLYPLVAYRLAQKYLRPLRSDVILLPRYDFDTYSTYMAAFSGCRHRIGYTETTTREKRLYNYGYDRLLSEVLPATSELHEVRHNMHFLAHLNCPVASDKLELWLPAESRLHAARLLNDYPAPYLGIVLSAGAPKRIWPAERFAAVAKVFLTQSSGTVILLGPPADQDRAQQFLLELKELKTRCLNLVGKTNTSESAAYLAHCQYFVGNDSGPVHIAAAAGAAVVVVSCHPQTGRSTSVNAPARFHPWSDRCTVVQPLESAAGCGDECDQVSPHCILHIPITAVLAPLQHYINLNKIN